MVNTEDFTRRLHQIMEYYDLSAASFADRIDVGRSSISHLLSGRNKPSLDFVMKIINAFPEVELYWLLNGKGTFPVSQTNASGPPPVSAKNESRDQQDLFPAAFEEGQKSMPSQKDEKKEIQKIIFFYTDGSFDAFEN